LVRALMAHQDYQADAQYWEGSIAKNYRILLLEGGKEILGVVVNAAGEREMKLVRKGMRKSLVNSEVEQIERSGELALGKMLRCRIRYFTDGAVIGSRSFVNEMFTNARKRFSPKRKTGARKMKGNALVASKLLWSLRDLQKGIS
jgi:putative transposase